MKNPYRVLAALSALFNVIGIISIIAGVALAIYVVYQGLQVDGAPVTSVLLNGAVFLVGGILGGLLIMGIGQLLRLQMDMAASARQTEINTRMTAKLVQRQLNKPAPVATRVAPQSSMPRDSVNDFDNDFSFLG